MTPLEAEQAVAALGLDAIMRGSPSWSLERQNDAASFPKRARALLLKALGNPDPDPSDEDLPPFEYDDVVELLEADDEEVERRTNALYDALPDDIQDDVEAAATRAIAHLQNTLPKRVMKTTARVDVTPPEPFELDRFARAYRVAVDPMWALRAMAVGGLDMVMVEAMEALYPALYELIATPGGLLDDALAAMKARRGEKWDVTDDQDRQVKILIGADPIDLDLANDFAAVAQAPAPPPRAGGAKAVKPTEELLPGQKQA